jgi:flavorubredoxin/Na+-transporting NADH:ubiquinone oxidoreductase subunit NqrF
MTASNTYHAVKVTDHVYWVGAIDWDVRNFHGYLTGRGTTYNAYLILADHITLIDTVKAPFIEEMFSRIASIIDPAQINYIVSNHSEMDHSGALPQTIERVNPSEVFVSKMGAKALANHFHLSRSFTVVGDGDSVDLGSDRLSFAETRMCHWPDSMVSYLHGARLLFSQDAFGMHLAGDHRFADEYDPTVLAYESSKYYANILMHLGTHITKALDKLTSLNLPFDIVAPDHGPIYRRPEDIQSIFESYTRWTQMPPTNKAVVLYDTMWGSTAMMARAVAEGLISKGADVKVMSLTENHRSDVVTELLEAGAIVVGSPTMNNQVFPSLADTMTYIRGLRPKNLVGACFGSYGWSGEAPKQLKGILDDLGIPLVADPLRINYVPDAAALAQCHDLGKQVARAMKDQMAGIAPEAGAAVEAPPAATCLIDINGGDVQLTAEIGKTLFEALKDNHIELPSLCGGAGMCGFCKVKVLSDLGEPNAAEQGHLSKDQLAAGIRLGCQITLTSDIAIEVPHELLGVQRFSATVEAIEPMTHDIHRVRMALTDPAEMTFRAGQYIKLNVPAAIAGQEDVSRAFSLASDPANTGQAELIIRRVPNGLCTNWVFNDLAVGNKVSFAGPFGEFELMDTDREMVWVAGGSGLSPFIAMLHELDHAGATRPCRLFFGAVAKRDLYLVDWLSEFAKNHEWFTFIPALSVPAEGDEWAGETGLITEVLDRHLAQDTEAEAYLCGSPGMLAACVEVLCRKGIPADRTFFDEFKQITS